MTDAVQRVLEIMADLGRRSDEMLERDDLTEGEREGIEMIRSGAAKTVEGIEMIRSGAAKTVAALDEKPSK